MTVSKKNIALTGPPGIGKSAVGKLLATELSRTFLDTDQELVKQFGCSISSYFEQYGEPSFRTAESAILAKACNVENLVIATGGGILIDPQNRNLLEQTCTAINLKASIKDLLERQKNSTHRPLLQGQREAKLRALMLSRQALYDSVGKQVNTSGKSVTQVVQYIIRLL